MLMPSQENTHPYPENPSSLITKYLKIKEINAQGNTAVWMNT